MLSLLLTAALGLLAPDDARALIERYNRVESAIEIRDYDQALRGLTALVRDYGRSEYGDELRYALAETYFNLGDYPQALVEFRRILDRPEHDYIAPEAMYGVAVSSIMLGSYRNAQQTLVELARRPGYAEDERAGFAFGVLHYFQKEYPQAIERLAGLDLPPAKFYLANCYAATDRPLQALLKFNEVAAEVPGTPLATLADFAAGMALFRNLDHDGARAKFQLFVDNHSHSVLADYARYFLGCALIAQHEYAAAIDQLLPITRHPNNFLAAHANYFIGYSDMALGKAQQAVERFQRVRASYPNTRIASFANLELTQAMLATQDTAQTLLATSQLAEMFKTGDLSGVGNYLSGVVFYQTGRYPRAAEQFEYILTNFGTTALREPAAAMLLLSLNSTAQHERAIAVGTRYLNDFPDTGSEWRAKTLHFLAEAFYSYRRYNEADNYYQLAYSHGRSGDIAPYARLGRAYCLYHLGRLDEAVRGFKVLLGAQPADTLYTIGAYLGYGYSLFNQQNYLEALDVFEALSNTFPDEPRAAVPAIFFAGYSYYEMEYYGQAVDAWTQLMNRYPEGNDKVAEAAFRTGDTYFKALEYDKALATFNFVIERHPYSEFGPSAQALVAQCYYNREQYLDAVREYQKFLDLYPSDPQGPSVRKSLEVSFYRAGLQDSVVMEEFLSRFSQSEMAAEAQFARGRRLFDAGSFEQAVVELQKAVVGFPGSPAAAEAQLLTAEAYAQLEAWPDAARAYQKFRDYYPDHDRQPGACFNQGIALFNAGEYQAAIDVFRVVIDEHGDSEYAESARTNLDVARKRLGAETGEESPLAPKGEEGSTTPPNQDTPTEGGQQ